MAQIIEKTLDAGGCSLHVLEAGSTSGKPVILLHGKNFQAQTWLELGTMDVLADLGLRVLAVDMPGYGKSGACDLSYTDVLVCLCETEHVDKAIFIGPSMGGKTVLEFAIAHPEKIEGLVLIGAVGVAENRKSLSRITAPVLVLWGAEDQVSPISNSDVLLAELPHARREIYPGAPHPCYLKQPERWHESLKVFVQDLSK